MNGFTLIGVGTLARDPEILLKREIPFVRFCLVGQDYAETNKVGHPRELITNAWFIAFDHIADDIARNSRKGDQLIVEARIYHGYHMETRVASKCATLFLVTGFRYGAKHGGDPSADSAAESIPIVPLNPETGEVAESSRLHA